MTKGEWSGWMQAIFSVVAIGAAILLAWWQRHVTLKEAENRSRDMARVAASGVLLTINQILVCIEFVSSHIEIEGGAGSFNPEKRIYELEALRHPTDFERMALLEWAPLCAKELALGRGLLAEALSALQRIFEVMKFSSRIEEDVIEALLRIFERARGHYQNALPLLQSIAA